MIEQLLHIKEFRGFKFLRELSRLKPVWDNTRISILESCKTFIFYLKTKQKITTFQFEKKRKYHLSPHDPVWVRP